MTGDTKPLTREEVERFAHPREWMEDSIGLRLARTCLALMDERDRDTTQASYWRALGSTLGLSETSDEWGDPDQLVAVVGKLMRGFQLAERKAAHMEAVIAVEQGRHVPGVTDGWECMVGYGSEPHEQWFFVGDSSMDEHIEAGAADRLPWLRRKAVGWWLSLDGDRHKAEGPFGTAHAAITAANAAKAAEEEG